QLVEYFLDEHTDKFKTSSYFEPGDIVLDPFCGSGTTLVQASELGIHAIGIDISEFNSLISNVKVGDFNIFKLEQAVNQITYSLETYLQDKQHQQFEDELKSRLSEFNRQFFPSPEYKFQVREGSIDEEEYSRQKEDEFRKIYAQLIEEFGIQLLQKKQELFLDRWYLKPVRDEIDFVLRFIQEVDDENTKRIIQIILSRAVRSCRATTHSDLATLIDPISETYYCKKHYKICKPLFSMLGKWKRYSKDTIDRLLEFQSFKTATLQHCLTGDAAKADILAALMEHNPTFGKLLKEQKIRGIFSSPPYVGLIDYHEQHAYAYELFGLERRDAKEIGPLSGGRSKLARKKYVEGISSVLSHCKKYLVDDYEVFLVANDQYGLYPKIAENAGMKIVNTYKRPVLARTERNKAAFGESIFQMREK
ncbi:MAG: DNA methyltransferase, partial [Candidatus Thorarchaeota archaeon]|nr:DNA methyltransferase [Candidatus Thorarchaeota archaeon]